MTITRNISRNISRGLSRNITENRFGRWWASAYPNADMATDFTQNLAMSNQSTINLSDLLGVTRASVKNVQNASSGLFTQFAANVLAVDSSGLDIEPESTNEVEDSTDASGWSRYLSGGTLTDTTNDVAMGDVTFKKIEFKNDAGGSWNRAWSVTNLSFSAGDEVAVTSYYIAGTTNLIGLDCTRSDLQVINLSGTIGGTLTTDGTAGTIADIETSSFTVGSETVYKTTHVITLTTTDTYSFGMRHGGSGSVFLLGQQVERRDAPTSFIVTSGSSAARSADIVKFTDTSWLTQGQGTIYVSHTPRSYRATGVDAVGVFEISNNALALGSDRMVCALESLTNNGTGRFQMANGGSVQADIRNVGSSISVGTQIKFAAAYEDNSVNAAQNGTLDTEDTSSTVPTIATPHIFIGQAFAKSSSHQYNGKIGAAVYYPTRLSDTEIQDLTA